MVDNYQKEYDSFSKYETKNIWNKIFKEEYKENKEIEYSPPQVFNFENNCYESAVEGSQKPYPIAGINSQYETIKENKSGNKYLKEIFLIDGKTDIYAIIEAYEVKCPARQHAIKKLLCAGARGKGDTLQDLKECRDAIDRAIQLQINRELKR